MLNETGLAIVDALEAMGLSQMGALTALTTLTKTSLVAAINEVDANNKATLAMIWHNMPRAVPKDITSYYEDGTLYKRLAGTDGYSKYEDLYVGDYFAMSRAVSAHNPDQTQQITGSQYVTIIGISCLRGNGSTSTPPEEHLVLAPGKGLEGLSNSLQHFGNSRMNATNVTTGGYVGSEMFTDVIGAVASSGSTAASATINQQLYAEFGSHLKTTNEWLTNAINSTGYNRFGTNSGCSSGAAWTDVQAVLMSEAEVYGTAIWGSAGYDSAMNPYQFPLFAHSKTAANNRSKWYWLRDIASGSDFCSCSASGFAACYAASGAHGGCRPRFVIA